MNRHSSLMLSALILAGGLLASPRARAQVREEPLKTGEEPGARPAIVPVKVVLKVRKQQQEARLTLIHRTKEKVLGVFSDTAAAGIRREINVDDVESAQFTMDIDPQILDKAVLAQDWEAAIYKVLMPVVKPTLPFLDLANNNAAPRALEMGDYMMRLGDSKRLAARNKADEEKAQAAYKAAYTVLSYVSQAKWSPVAAAATLKTSRCLLVLDKPETARKVLDTVPEPAVGDAAYGLFWLVRAELDAQKGDFRLAIDNAVKSAAFENKDVDTFPDALMLLARCHEELQEWYRARDIYYEVAVLFSASPWSKAARQRLTFMREKDFTKAEEKDVIENVFFGIKEDINKKVEALLASEDTRVFDEKAEAAGKGTERVTSEAKFSTKDKSKDKKKEEDGTPDPGPTPPSADPPK